MSGVALNIDASDLRDLEDLLGDLDTSIKSRDLQLVAGRSGQQTIKEHLQDISQDRDHHESAESLGAPRTGFYFRAAQAVQNPVVEGQDAVSISIDHQGLAQRYHGGDIEAKPGGYLTIPARAEAYGHRARELQDLQFILFPSGLAALVDKNEKAHEGSVYYWLVRSVHQPEDKSVMPRDDEVLDPAMAAVRAFALLQFERKKGAR